MKIDKSDVFFLSSKFMHEVLFKETTYEIPLYLLKSNDSPISLCYRTAEVLGRPNFLHTFYSYAFVSFYVESDILCMSIR